MRGLGHGPAQLGEGRMFRMRRKCWAFTTVLFICLSLSACGARDESAPLTQSANSDKSLSNLSSNGDEKVPEPLTCPDYQDSYSTPYKYCDSGTAVTRIQEALSQLGYSLDVDGYYGPGTRSAVERFQSSRGLTVTGQVNDATWSSLFRGASSTPDYNNEDAPSYLTPIPQVVIPQREIVGVICELRKSGLSSSWYGQSYYWFYYNVWSDGTRSVIKSGQGYNPPYDCL